MKVVRDTGVVGELSREHGAMARQLAGLQQRIGGLLAANARRIALLEADNLRLRAELVVCRTGLLWGLGAGVLQPRAARRQRLSGLPDMAAAQVVICQTGCAGHAHPWRDDEGQCRRTGLACAPATPETFGGDAE